MTAIDKASFQTGLPGAGDQTAAQNIVVLPAPSGDALLVPEGFPLVSAAFERQGSDLMLVAKDGSHVLIENYFAHEPPPALTTVGGAVLPADLVEMLAGPMAPGQYAQLGSGGTAVPIGTVATIDGSVTATRADGTVVSLALDVDVFQGDVLETEAGATVGLVFNDDTTFALGENGRMVLDKLIFDPDSGEGESAFSVLEGAFVFVSGQIAANNPDEMLVRTPVATIGVRGTKVAGWAAPEGEENKIVMLEDLPGLWGSITVSNETGQILVTNPNEPLSLYSAFESPEQVPYDQAEFDQKLGAVLDFLPEARGQRPGGGDGSDEIIGAFGADGLAGDPEADALGGPDLGLDAFAAPTEIDLPPLVGVVSEPNPRPITPPPDDGRIVVNLTGEPDFFDGNLDGFDGKQLEINGLGGNDIIFGSRNNGTVGDIVNGGEGDDQLVGAHLEGELFGTGNFADTLNGGLGNDTLQGLAGSDVLDGGSGLDDLDGNEGNDALNGGDDGDNLDGGDGNDVLRGGDGFDFLNGADGNDVLDGGDGNDNVLGGNGNDTILGGTGLGDDTLDGGADSDTLTYASTTLGVDVDLSENFAQGFDEGSADIGFDNIFNFEIVIGGSGGDDILGAGIAETIFGGLGDDDLEGGGENDSLSGGAGDDTLEGGEGNDTIDGGGGFDGISFEDDPAGVTANFATGTATDGFGDSDSFSGIEAFVGSEFADTGTALGLSTGVEFFGEGGDDTLTGGSGNDTLFGDAGNDLLAGGPGNDLFVYETLLDTADIPNNGTIFDQELFDHDQVVAFESGIDQFDFSPANSIPGGHWASAPSSTGQISATLGPRYTMGRMPPRRTSWPVRRRSFWMAAATFTTTPMASPRGTRWWRTSTEATTPLPAISKSSPRFSLPRIEVLF